MKKFGKVLLITAVTSSMLVTPVFAEPSVNDLESEKAAAESQVSELQAELTDLLDKMGRLEEDLIHKGEEISQAKEDLEAAEVKEKEQYEAMKLRIKYMYENGDISAMETLVTAKDFSDLVNKAEYVQNVHTYDRNKLQEYVETKQQVADLKDTLETEQANMESMQAEYEQKETTLNTTIETKQAEISNFDEQIQAAAEAAAAEAAAREAEANRNNGSSVSENNNGGGGGNNSGGNAVVNNGGGSNSSSSSSGGGGNASTAQAIVSAAYSQLGVPYVWGGSTPYGGLDCSGLVQYCHSVAGIGLPRTSQAQGGGGRAVSSPEPGDVVCYGTHIGIYIGGGQMIHAPKPGDVVKVASVYGSPWYRRYW